MTTKSMHDPDLLKAKRAAANLLLAPDSFFNVLAVGIGKKAGNACLHVYVQSKDVPEVTRIPKTFRGFDTLVREIGRFGRLRQGPVSRDQIGPGFPIRFDSDAPNVNAMAIGTLGATVRSGDDYYVLSCNHILAANGRVPPGTPIVSAQLIGSWPKPATIATFEGEGYYIPIDPEAINEVDCALAKLDQRLTPGKFETIAPLEPKRIVPGMGVRKDGAITGRTSGTIIELNADVSVDYSFGTFRFRDQILIDGGKGADKRDQEFAWDGDSGAIVTDEAGHPLAMVLAEAGRFAVACPLARVFERMQNVEPFRNRELTMSMQALGRA